MDFKDIEPILARIHPTQRPLFPSQFSLYDFFQTFRQKFTKSLSCHPIHSLAPIFTKFDGETLNFISKLKECWLPPHCHDPAKKLRERFEEAKGVTKPFPDVLKLPNNPIGFNPSKLTKNQQNRCVGKFLLLSFPIISLILRLSSAI